MADDKGVKCVKGKVDGRDYGLHRASSPLGKKLLSLQHYKGVEVEIFYLDREHAPEVTYGR